MKYLLRIVLITQFYLVFGSVVDPNSGWSYTQSTGQTFYMFVDSDQIWSGTEAILTFAIPTITAIILVNVLFKNNAVPQMVDADSIARIFILLLV